MLLEKSVYWSFEISLPQNTQIDAASPNVVNALLFLSAISSARIAIYVVHASYTNLIVFYVIVDLIFGFLKY